MDEAMLKEFERLNRKIDQLTDTNSHLVTEVSGQSKTILEQSALIANQTLMIGELTDANKKHIETNERLIAEIAAKDEQIAKLQRKNGMNSRNSSMPPSSDRFTKPRPSKINEGDKGKKRSGGQVGHKGSTMRLKAEPDEVRPCLPSDCITCKRLDSCPAKAVVLDSRNVVDVRIITTQSRYDRIGRTCPLDGRKLVGSYPEGVNAPMQYGAGLKALVVSLSSFGMVSANRIVEMLEGVGVSISDGTVCNIIDECARLCDERVIPRLREEILGRDIIHCDETGIKIKAKNHWAHTSSTADVTLIQTHPKRGLEAIKDIGILPSYQGIAVHDCWPSYFNKSLNHVTKALCGAHIDRELQGVIENHKDQSWAKRMQALLAEIYKSKQRLVSQGESEAPDEMIGRYSEQYDKIIRQGHKQCPFKEPKQKKRGRPSKGKVRNLLERLEKLKDAVLRFFTDFRVPFSNNIAERSYRLAKCKQKVSGTFRSQRGGANFCSIYSFIDTSRKNGRKLFDELEALFNKNLSLEYLGISAQST